MRRKDFRYKTAAVSWQIAHRATSFQQVARAMGCSRTTLWQAYYGSQSFRHRVWWERQALNRESDLRLASLRALVTEQVERLGLFREFDAQPGKEGRDSAPTAAAPSATSPGNPPTDPQPASPAIPDDSAEPFDDDSVPGAIRERTPPNPKEIAAILDRPESEGPKGVYPWTFNPDDHFPNLGSALERQGGQGAFTRRR